MADAHSLKIGEIIQDIAENKYLLPAIQREFVWKPGQICELFDSLMRKYPIGTFLFWKISPEYVDTYRFYAFMRSYHERDNYRCQQPDHVPRYGFQAVLDGQQRLTALFIGLRGSYAQKVRYGRWNEDRAFPVTRLYLNLLHDPEPEDGRVIAAEDAHYMFEFKTEEEAIKDKQKGRWWFPCARICESNWNVDSFCDDEVEDSLDEISFGVSESEALSAKKKLAKKDARHVIRRLHEAVHIRNEITYFSEKTSDLDRVLNIFIRLNSGGTPLSYSDLLLSIAIAQWQHADAREEINKLKNDLLNRYDFDLSKDFILKACLMLSDIKSVKFEVKNFNKENTALLENNWNNCKYYLLLAVSLLRSFGYTSANLLAANSILPIAYYLKTIQAREEYLESTKYEKDRSLLQLWFNRTTLKQGTWGASVDTLLTQLREAIIKAVPHKTDTYLKFPYDELDRTLARVGHGLQFSVDEVDELLELTYGKPRTFTLLSLIFPSCGIQMSDEHVDHIYPQALFSRKKQLANAGYTPEDIEKAKWMHNMLPNLQLLPSRINREKSDLMPLEWLKNTFTEEQAKSLSKTQFLEKVSNDPKDFFSFYQNRRESLRELIAKKLGVILPEKEKLTDNTN